jgi:hypothetical protein
MEYGNKRRNTLQGGSRMQAIRDLIDTEKLKHIMNIPENFGDKVEVIVLPFNKDEKSESYYLTHLHTVPFSIFK